MKKDDLGDRMKELERRTDTRLMPLLPVVARLDGKCFSSFTKGLERPYDQRMSDLMVHCTEFLVKETSALLGYTQSDEITLIWYSADPKSQIFFDGRLLKMASVLAAMVSVEFSSRLGEFITEKVGKSALFDCRVFSVPTKTEAVNALIWREQDAVKNSISMAARAYFSHKELMNKTCKEMQEMLFSVYGVNWNDYPAFFKRGTYVRRTLETKPFTPEELEALPEKHHARYWPGMVVERHVVNRMDWEPLTKMVNRVGVIFDGEEPEEYIPF